MKWEYLVYPLTSENWIPSANELGAQGWELVAVDDGIAYLKRPIPEHPKRTKLKAIDTRAEHEWTYDD